MAEKLNGSAPGVGHNVSLSDDEYFSFASDLDGAESALAAALANCKGPRNDIKIIRKRIEERIGRAGLKAFDRAREDDKHPASEREAEDQHYRRMMRWLRKPVGTQGAMFDDADVTPRPFSELELARIEEQGYQAGLDGERSDTCTHTPGADAFARWMTGWTRGQGEKVTAMPAEPPKRGRGRPRNGQQPQA